MQRSLLPPAALLALPLAIVQGCSSATLNRTAVDIAGQVIQAGVGLPGTSLPREPAPAPAAARVLGTAEEYLGVPYRWGGDAPSTGFDCSGYVKYVYARQGVHLPRTSREQAQAGRGVTVSLSALRAGDLVMFAESRRPISHVAIYAGSGRIIHSSSSGGGVRYDDLHTHRGAWYVQHMVAARRLAVDGRSLVQSLELLTRPGLPFDPPDRAPKN